MRSLIIAIIATGIALSGCVSDGATTCVAEFEYRGARALFAVDDPTLTPEELTSLVEQSALAQTIQFTGMDVRNGSSDAVHAKTFTWYFYAGEQPPIRVALVGNGSTEDAPVQELSAQVWLTHGNPIVLMGRSGDLPNMTQRIEVEYSADKQTLAPLAGEVEGLFKTANMTLKGPVWEPLSKTDYCARHGD